MKDFNEGFDLFKREVSENAEKCGDSKIQEINLEKFFGNLNEHANLKSFQIFFKRFFFNNPVSQLHMKQFMLNLPITGLFSKKSPISKHLMKQNGYEITSTFTEKGVSSASSYTQKLNRMSDYLTKIRLILESETDLSSEKMWLESELSKDLEIDLQVIVGDFVRPAVITYPQLNESFVSTFLLLKLFEPAITLFNLLTETEDVGIMPEISAFFNPKSGASLDLETVSDYIITPENEVEPIVTIEVKRGPLTDSISSFNPFVPKENFSKVVSEVIHQAITLQINFGILADLNVICFIEVLPTEEQDTNKYEENEEFFQNVKIKFKIFKTTDNNIISYFICFLKKAMDNFIDKKRNGVENNDNALCYKLFKSSKEFIVEHEKVRKSLKENFAKTDFLKSTTTIGTCDMDLKIRYDEKYMKPLQFRTDNVKNSHVFILNKRSFGILTGQGREEMPNLPNGDFVLKIIDPVQVRRSVPLAIMAEKCNRYFTSEVECYNILSRQKAEHNFKKISPEIFGFGYCNLINYHQKEEVLISSGLYLLLELISGVPPKLDIETSYDTAEENLIYMHSLHIVHGDIRLENMIETPKGEIYFLDFGFGSTNNISGGLQEDGDEERLESCKKTCIAKKEAELEELINKNKKRKLTKRKRNQ